ncbi:hypothetical protein Mapa_015185 [Marchantia paleacea]|nr:hypothetical protein Mapa_015185 [Marchantia paleacea]
MPAISESAAETFRGISGFLGSFNMAGTNLTFVYNQAQDASLSTSGTYISLIAVAVTSAWFFMKWLFYSKNYTLPLPPGGLGLPFVGDTISFIMAFRNDSMWQFWEEKAAKYGPIFKFSVLGETAVAMDPPEGNRFLFYNEHGLFRSAWPDSLVRLMGKHALIVKAGEAYKVSRRHLVKRFMSRESVLRYVPKMDQNCLKHIEKNWNPGDGEREVNTFEVTKHCTFAFACDVLMTLTDPDEVEALQHLVHLWGPGVLAIPVNLPGFAFHRALKARSAIGEVFLIHIRRRREQLKDGTAAPYQDLLSLLLTEKDDQGHMYTDEEMVDNLFLLLTASHDTTASVLTFTIDAVARYPQIYNQIIKEHAGVAAEMGENQEGLQIEDLRKMKYTWQVIQEVMRLYPPVVASYRRTSEDVEYQGYTIPKGWKVLWASTRSHQNPAFFEKPNEFDPSRFENRSPDAYSYLPFGSGARSCPGNEVAKLQMLLFMHRLLKNFRWTLVDPNEKRIIRDPMPHTPKGTPVKVTRCRVF